MPANQLPLSAGAAWSVSLEAFLKAVDEEGDERCADPVEWAVIVSHDRVRLVSAVLAELKDQGVGTTKRLANVAVDDLGPVFKGRPAGELALVKEATAFLERLVKEERGEKVAGAGVCFVTPHPFSTLGAGMCLCRIRSCPGAGPR